MKTLKEYKKEYRERYTNQLQRFKEEHSELLIRVDFKIQEAVNNVLNCVRIKREDIGLGSSDTLFYTLCLYLRETSDLKVNMLWSNDDLFSENQPTKRERVMQISGWAE